MVCPPNPLHPAGHWYRCFWNSLASEVLRLPQERPLPMGEQLRMHRVRVQTQRDTQPHVGKQGDLLVNQQEAAAAGQSLAKATRQHKALTEALSINASVEPTRLQSRAHLLGKKSLQSRGDLLPNECAQDHLCIKKRVLGMGHFFTLPISTPALNDSTPFVQQRWRWRYCTTRQGLGFFSSCIVTFRSDVLCATSWTIVLKCSWRPGATGFCIFVSVPSY